jgi:hypothetical protein
MSFAFNASALAFGARFELPDNSIIPSQASVALAPTGGDGYETVRNFNYKGIITFDEASVYVSGSEHGTVRNTLASVTIKNLNVLNLLHADLLSSRITSRHVLGEDEGEITFHGSSADNLRIAGKPVQVNFNHDFYSRYSTHEKLAGALAKPGQNDVPGMQQLLERDAKKCDCTVDESRKKTLAQLLGDRFCWDPAGLDKGAPNDPNLIHCSLVDSIDGIDVVNDADFKDHAADLRAQFPVRRHGYIVKVAEFGTIKIGELIIKPGERRLNLLRFDFGCPFVGSATSGSVMNNGSEMVP